MASDKTWSRLRYFKKDSKVDKWGDPRLINDNLLFRLDDFRHWLGVPIFVTSGVRVNGSANSYHSPSKGACAVDIVIPHYMETAIDMILDATRFGFTGIGYYPHWRYDGKRVGGLHLDMRPLKWDDDDTKNYSHSRWMGVMIGDKQSYIEMDFQNIVDHYPEDDDGNSMH